MENDDATQRFYRDNAATYAAWGRGGKPERLSAFLAALPAHAAILELGCGAGHDSAKMLAAGFEVRVTDGVAEIAREAERRLGRPVDVLAFAEIEERGRYDGVWASACLLHVPRDDLAGVLARIHHALRPGGVFYASYKAGEAEGRDRFDRYYNAPSAAWLQDCYLGLAWARVDIEEAAGGGYDGLPTRWLHVTAVKAG